MTTIKTNKDLEIDIDDILCYGIFDGSHQERLELVAAATYISPLSWVTKNQGKDNEVVLFFEDNKLSYYDPDENEDDIDPEDHARLKIHKGDCWIAYASYNDDNDSLSSGFSVIDDYNFGKLTFHKLVDNTGIKVIKVDSDNTAEALEELNQWLDKSITKEEDQIAELKDFVNKIFGKKED